MAQTKEEIQAYRKAWRDANKEKLKAYMRSYHAANKEKLNAQHRARYEANGDKYKAQKKLYYVANKKEIHSKQIKRAYGIGHEEQKHMFISQGGVCAICGNQFKNSRDMHVDHCHKTGKIRQLLCHNCNRGIGFLQDDIGLLSKAIDYLNKWNNQPTGITSN